MRRIFPFYLIVLLGVIAFRQASFGQGGPPAGAGRPTPGFDLSGYWTAAMHEDALERGGGPETADYGGFPINEAARLFGLSYNVSRVTLCATINATGMWRRIRSARSVTHAPGRSGIRTRSASSPFTGTTRRSKGVERSGWMAVTSTAVRPAHLDGFLYRSFCGQRALVVQATHIKQGWLRRERFTGKRSGYDGRVLRAPWGSPDLHVGHHRSRLPDRTHRQNHRFRTPARRSRQLVIRLRRR